jgi:hypothetical protein
MRRSLPETVGIGETTHYLDGSPGLTPENAPATAGNGTFTVAGLFRYDGGSTSSPLWATGDYSGSNTSVALQYTGAGTNLELAWGAEGADRWRFNSGFSMTAGTWYFIAVTVKANGLTPIAHMWIGEGGVLVDKIAGVAYAKTAGSPTQTPAVVSAPMHLGLLSGPSSVNASYAGLYIYDREISYSEAQLMFSTFKANMAARGETLNPTSRQLPGVRRRFQR